MPKIGLPAWTWLSPIVGALLLLGAKLGGAFDIALAAGLIACVLAAVHHAEVVAHKIGEPYGTLVLAVAVTVIEVALIVSLMLSGGMAASGLARDTVFAAIMIILNGLVGLCLLVGGARHLEQKFGQAGVSAALATLAAMTVLTLVLPNYTTSTPGPVYSGSQLASIGLTIPVVAVVSLVMDWPLSLGLDAKAMVLLMLTLIVTTLSLGTGRTTVLQGVVHLLIFAVYLFTTVVP